MLWEVKRKKKNMIKTLPPDLRALKNQSENWNKVIKPLWRKCSIGVQIRVKRVQFHLRHKTTSKRSDQAASWGCPVKWPLSHGFWLHTPGPENGIKSPWVTGREGLGQISLSMLSNSMGWHWKGQSVAIKSLNFHKKYDQCCRTWGTTEIILWE